MLKTSKTPHTPAFNHSDWWNHLAEEDARQATSDLFGTVAPNGSPFFDLLILREWAHLIRPGVLENYLGIPHGVTMLRNKIAAKALITSICVPTTPAEGITVDQAERLDTLFEFLSNPYAEYPTHFLTLLKTHLRAENLRPRPETYDCLSFVPSELVRRCGFSANIPNEWNLIFRGLMNSNFGSLSLPTPIEKVLRYATGDPVKIITMEQWCELVATNMRRNQGRAIAPLFRRKYLPLAVKSLAEASSRVQTANGEPEGVARYAVDHLPELPIWQFLVKEYRKGEKGILPEPLTLQIEITLSKMV